jgi:hypothetical protein
LSRAFDILPRAFDILSRAFDILPRVLGILSPCYVLFTFCHALLTFCHSWSWIPKNLAPWRDSNPGSSVLKADAMTTMLRRLGRGVIGMIIYHLRLWIFVQLSRIFMFIFVRWSL